MCHHEGMSEIYQVLARRLRPRLFKELVGQDVFVRLIQRAFLKDRLASAFLLTGIRGVGKTTIARLLGKTMNCKASFKGAEWVEPCGDCVSCIAFDEGGHPDILEIDAASHTGVDDVRRILETCQYNALVGQYKVFIVDEVHMLSKSAFNALLKTLEAPPPHVKFILATTEVEKIPLTVISRCLRFDLRRIERGVIQDYLADVCAAESVCVDKDALLILAEAADGSLRDALSILEQALLLANQSEGALNLNAEDVRTLLGLKGDTYLREILQAILNNDAGVAIQVSRRAYGDGSDPLRMVDALSGLVHRISCAKTASKDDDLSVYGEDADFLREQADAHSLAIWGRLWQMLMKGRKEMLDAAFAQRAFEMLLIRLAYATQLPTPDKLVKALHHPEDAEASVSSNTTPSGREVTLPSTLKTPEDLLKMLKDNREGVLHAHFFKDTRVITLKEPLLEIAVNAHVPSSFQGMLQTFLAKKTGRLWQVRMVDNPGVVETLHDQDVAKQNRYLKDAENNPLTQAVRSHLGPGVVLSLKEPNSWKGDMT